MDLPDDDADDATRAPPAPHGRGTWHKLPDAPSKQTARVGILHLRANLRQRANRRALTRSRQDLRLLASLLPFEAKQVERVQQTWHDKVQRESQLSASRSTAIVRIQQQARFRDETQALCRACRGVLEKRGKTPWLLPRGLEVVSWLRRFVYLTPSALCYRRCCSRRRQQFVDVASTRMIMLSDIEQITGKLKSRVICVRARYRPIQDDDDEPIRAADGQSVLHEFLMPSLEATK